jgi:hypothetical protein
MKNRQMHKPTDSHILKTQNKDIYSFWPVSPVKTNLTIASDRIIAAFAGRLFKAKTAPFLEVLLMVFLCSVELLSRQNLGYDLPVQQILLMLQRLPCCLLLLRCVEVYTRSVLRSHIITLCLSRIFKLLGSVKWQG